VVAGTLGCSKKEAPSPSTVPAAPPVPEAKPTSAGIVRVASVKTAVEGNVLPELVADFEKSSSYKVEVTPGEAVYTWAREGKVDLVISHYGHQEAEDFVLDGLGEWPRTMFSNQMALVGPPSDPAKVRGLEDAGEAFRRIAASKSTFVVNNIDGVKYLTDILWNAAGRPDRSGWFLDGARALQAHVLSPVTQARIRSIRYPGDQRVCWVPAGRNNRFAMLPKG
jgi:tungstate transport system substrate-binding protein